MRLTSLSLLPSLALTTGALATVTPGTLFGDAYLVADGARTYSVLDVYIKCSNSADIISSTFGTSGWNSSYTLNNGKTFKQSNGNGTNSSWLPAAGTTSWDSFVTCGNRDQASAAATLSMQLDTNWGAGNGGTISSAAGTGGAGWYPAVGASSATNPYCRAGFYTGTGANNTAKTLLSGNGGIDGTISGNGITAGQSLTNHWMVGRFTIEVTGESASANNTLTLQFGVAGKNNGTTTFTGATSSAGRFNSTLTFASIPAPGAISLMGLAGLISRRRAA